MAKVAVYTIGCKVNQAESEELKMDLARFGHTICGDPAEADLCVVNTCTVTAESSRKSRKLIRYLGRRGAERIVASGCYAQIDPDALSYLPGLVALVPNSLKESWCKTIISLLPQPEQMQSVSIPLRTRGFIKVQDGCERFCSYCIVPLARGRERSRSPSRVLKAASEWIERGSGELVLCGVNLGRYSWGRDYDLRDLVKDIAALDGDFRIRLSSIELEDFRLEWLEEWSDMQKVCPHLHLPLQSGDAGILKDMGRSYSPENFISISRFIRQRWPGAALTTELIVGYPGESEDAFRETLRVLEEVRPARVHVFRFSPRPGTRAWERKDLTAAKVTAKRSTLARKMADGWRRSYAEERVGDICHMVAEKIEEKEGCKTASGVTEDYIKAVYENPPAHAIPGCILEARIDGLRDGRALLVRPA
ncbi:MAG: MiaB/RimO family radical SAM methylthiotransferase [Actinomycetota bacterium]|nr:MiaB/RimO family radical SAM methylthiotransferase [Actinomycetota bacterium]